MPDLNKRDTKELALDAFYWIESNILSDYEGEKHDTLDNKLSIVYDAIIKLRN